MHYKKNAIASWSNLTPAFVLKNDIYASRVILLHKYLGKITCRYTQRAQGQMLCIGSLLFCTLQKRSRYYVLDQIQVHFVPMQATMESLHFIHDIVRICLALLPEQVSVLELFDFLWYVYQQLYDLSEEGRTICLLRVFLLFDLLPEAEQSYRYAQQDPYDNINYTKEELHECLQVCWKRFHQHG